MSVSSSVHLFLWVSHGENIGSSNNFYPIETKFQSVILYSKPFKVITSEELSELLNNPCRLILGSCPSIPIIDEKTNKKDVLLPPLLFVNVQNDKPDIVEYSGLYHFVIKMNPEHTREMVIQPHDTDMSQYINSCVYEYSEKIIDHANLITLFGNNSYITYSQIYKLVTDQCKNKGLNPEDVLLGIFSCQIRQDRYSKEYNQQATNLIPRRVKPELSIAKIYDELDIDPQFYVSPTIIDFDKLPNSWNALARIKHQGCGLNVLSYFGILSQTYARESTVCLTLKGTSIFKITDHLNTYFKSKGIQWPGFIILRYTFVRGLQTIIGVMKLLKMPNVAIIFKMYNTNKAPDGKDSQIGHTVSIFKYNNKIYYVDPQAEIGPIQIDEMIEPIVLENEIKKVYSNPQWKYIDIIFTVSNTSLGTYRPEIRANELEKMVSDSHGEIEFLIRTQDINYGGKNILKSKKSNKKTIKKRILKNKNKYKSIKKRNNKKRSKKYYGGEGENDNDIFEELMIQIDKKYNTPTTLDSLTIKDI